MSTLADEFHAERELALAAQRAQRASYDTAHDRKSTVMREQREALLSLMRPAQKWEYEAWLTGFLKQGGKVTNFHDYPWRTGKFYTALSDFVIVPLYGALAVDIIVPKGIRLLGGETGHCNVYITTSFDEGDDAFVYQGFHDSTPHFNPHIVSAYSDTELLA